jgi:hypothetical protein
MFQEDCFSRNFRMKRKSAEVNRTSAESILTEWSSPGMDLLSESFSAVQRG